MHGSSLPVQNLFLQLGDVALCDCRRAIGRPTLLRRTADSRSRHRGRNKRYSQSSRFDHSRSRARRTDASQDSSNAQVLIHFRPMNTFSIAHQLEIGALLRSGVQEPREPCQRSRNGATISKANDQFCAADDDFPCARHFNRRSIHSTSQSRLPGAPIPTARFRATRAEEIRQPPPVPTGRARTSPLCPPVSHGICHSSLTKVYQSQPHCDDSTNRRDFCAILILYKSIKKRRGVSFSEWHWRVKLN